MKNTFILPLLFIPISLLSNDIWQKASETYGVNKYILYNISRVESGGNPFSVNFNKLTPTQREYFKSVFSTMGVKAKSYGSKNQHLSIDCKTKSCAETAITLALQNNLNFDVGIMNINSVHFSELEKTGITPYHLLDPELNIMTGAWEYRKCINRYGDNWTAVNCYNGLDYENRVYNKYAWKVYNSMTKKPQNNRHASAEDSSNKQSSKPSYLVMESEREL